MIRRSFGVVAIATATLASCGAPPPLRPQVPTASAIAPGPGPCLVPTPVPGKPFRVRVTLAPEIAKAPLSGRLIVFLSDAKEKRETLGFDFSNPRATWMAADEVRSLAPGATFELDPDRLAFPEPLSHAKPGAYRVMALLDVDHTFPRVGMDGGDVRSAAVDVSLDPSPNSAIDLRLDKVVDAPPPIAETESLKIARVPSALLSAFHGRPIEMRATVVLPPSAAKDRKRTFPTAYVIAGFGASEENLARRGAQLASGMASGAIPELAFVLLTGALPTGHHVFADSVNDGPWSRALVEELIPTLEKRFPLVPRASARFLNGHSSGGWSTLWLQITHADVFAGTWSTSPDPVDFHAFTTFDATPGSTDNAFRTTTGAPRSFFRVGSRDIMTFEELAKIEAVHGEYGGALGTFEWVFSPKGDDGRPLKLFDRVSGEQDPNVQRAWEKWDIRKVLESKWTTLAPKLRGKLHLFCGSADNFHLEDAMQRLCAWLEQRGSDATCEIAMGKGHFDIYGTGPNAFAAKDGLFARIAGEMRRAFDGSRAR